MEIINWEIIITTWVIVGGYLVYKGIRTMRVKKVIDKFVDEIIKDSEAQCEYEEVCIEVKPIAKKPVEKVVAKKKVAKKTK